MQGIDLRSPVFPAGAGQKKRKKVLICGTILAGRACGNVILVPPNPDHSSNPLDSEAIDPRSTDELMPLVYERLAEIAASYLKREGVDQILEPAVLVNESYLRLAANPPGTFTSHEHFLAVAARAMRQILIDHARRKRALKRGFGQSKVSLDVLTTSGRRNVDVRLIDSALRALSQVNERAASIVELRFFAGLTHDHVALVLGVSRKTVVKDWTMAREWLAKWLSDELAKHPELE
ncbi:MAG: ECF-type sigma factor [Planctomycetota bacterium]|jgi:RNA polymerase sigma factor (TIGR02999 family)